MTLTTMPIVVLTPTKNEDWILDEFLRITSLFADLILIADQHSTDNTADIIKNHRKAVYIKNESDEYDEEYRQRLLIEKARELAPGKKLLLALDADELITADSLGSMEWPRIMAQAAGTRILFKKPDVLPGLAAYLDYPDYFLLGYVDDGKPHSGTRFHSPRVPPSDKEYVADGIRFMHLALVRQSEYNARQRLYTVLENISRSSSLRLRYRKYSLRAQRRRNRNAVRKLPAEWTAAYNNMGIDLTRFPSSEINNYNRRILTQFNEYGTRRFWLEDIWYVDFDRINSELEEECKRRIVPPPFFLNVFRSAFISLYEFGLHIKEKLSRYRITHSS